MSWQCLLICLQFPAIYVSCLVKFLRSHHQLSFKSATTVVMPSKARPGRGVHEVLEELGLGSKQAKELLRTQLLAYNDVHDKELTRSLGDDYDELPLDVSLNFLNSHGGQFFGSGHSKWLWPKDSAALVGRIAEIMRRQHAYKRDPTRKRGRSKSPDSTASRSTKSSRRTSSRSRATLMPSRFMLIASQIVMAQTSYSLLFPPISATPDATACCLRPMITFS